MNLTEIRIKVADTEHTKAFVEITIEDKLTISNLEILKSNEHYVHFPPGLAIWDDSMYIRWSQQILQNYAKALATSTLMEKTWITYSVPSE